MNNELMHYGTKRHSGRYPYGSGEDPYQHEPGSWLARDNKLRKETNYTEAERAREMGCTNTSDYRALHSKYSNEVKAGEIKRARYLVEEKGYTTTKAAEIMGKPESTIRSLLKPGRENRTSLTQNTANLIKEQVDRDRYVDIGKGTELSLNVTESRMKNAVAMLKADGYKVQQVFIDQMGTNHQTTVKVLTPPDVEYKELMENKYNIALLGGTKIFNESGDIVGTTPLPPKSISSDRIKIRYNEEGGIDKDGVIELRRGVDDISLGKAHYAQVRIAVDGTHYLKGMAVYSDNMPDGVDIIFNTNKHTGTPKEKVFKELKKDPENPFGASIKDNDSLETLTQKYYIDKDGKQQQSAINVVNEEGDWNTWSKNLASQFLSKQRPALAKKQLNLDYLERKANLEDINNLTNPTIKKKLLESFADDCDAAAIHLKAAALPGQKTHVILPLPSLKENEIYAPNYENGTEVVLVRYPHGGIFEIPRLTVKNFNKEGKSVIGNSPDAVGIHPKAAEKLSGADFDGDTAIVIPIKAGLNIRTSESLEGLKGFDPKEKYPYREGMKIMTPRMKGIEMGKISNLITDMTLKGANDEELARAVRHSMVVIDAEKHKLDYRQSYEDNNIRELNKKYQDGGGVSTIISRAKSEVKVDARKKMYGITEKNTDISTGKRIYEKTNEEYVDKKTGKIVRAQDTITRMEATDDARDLMSSRTNPYLMETIYADYANQMKALANEARKSYLATGNLRYSPSAKKTYAPEVASLNTKLKTALSNAPKERQAQLLANMKYQAKLEADPNMDTEKKKKAKGVALISAREAVGAHKERIEITDREWEAIQAGAISESALASIIDNSDTDSIRKRATPRHNETVLLPSKEALIKAMAKNDSYTLADIAERCGVSTSTISKVLRK